MSHLLPTESGRTALLEALGELVSQRGHATLVRAPILRPHPSYFPDVWSPDAEGVRAMARRLMAYAGLEAFDVHVTLYANEVQLQHTASVGGIGVSRQKQGAAAWFAGFEGGTCLFGVDHEGLEDVEHLAGCLAHEVAHAWRHHHGLEEEERQLEEQLTDLTTIFLGFGLFTTNNTFRSRSSGELVGSVTMHNWSIGGAGYLSPQEMSFLLATQVVVRGSAREEVRMLERELKPTQLESFTAARQLLEQQPEMLRYKLGVPPPSHWEALPPPVRLFDAAAIPLPWLVDAKAEEPELEDDEVDEAEDQESARESVAFRVPESRGFLFWWLGLVAILPLLVFESSWVLLLPVAGWWLGRRYPSFYCSNSDCNARVRTTDSHCPDCGLLLAATLKRARDRWDAEEEYWRQRGGAPAKEVALERALTKEALSASPEAQVKPSEGNTLLWLLRVLLPVVLVFVGFFAVLAVCAYFFSAP